MTQLIVIQSRGIRMDNNMEQNAGFIPKDYTTIELPKSMIDNVQSYTIRHHEDSGNYSFLLSIKGFDEYVEVSHKQYNELIRSELKQEKKELKRKIKASKNRIKEINNSLDSITA